MTYLCFSGVFFAFIFFINYFRNWKDERPDLGGFGGRK